VVNVGVPVAEEAVGHGERVPVGTGTNKVDTGHIGARAAMRGRSNVRSVSVMAVRAAGA
jgi:hypothetical protein